MVKDAASIWSVLAKDTESLNIASFALVHVLT